MCEKEKPVFDRKIFEEKARTRLNGCNPEVQGSPEGMKILDRLIIKLSELVEKEKLYENEFFHVVSPAVIFIEFCKVSVGYMSANMDKSEINKNFGKHSDKVNILKMIEICLRGSFSPMLIMKHLENVLFPFSPPSIMKHLENVLFPEEEKKDSQKEKP